MHLMRHTPTQIVIIGISKVTGITIHQMVARLGRNNIEKVGLSASVTDKPLRRIGLDRFWWNRADQRTLAVVP